MSIGFDIKQSDKEIERMILRTFCEEMNSRVARLRPKVEKWIREEVSFRLLNCETLNSLKTGKLRGEFGLSDSDLDKIDKLVDRFVRSISVTTTPLRLTTRGLSVSPILRVKSETLKELADSPNAEVITRKGVSIPFLEMLCEWGDKQIINWYIREGNSWERINISRSHSMIMEEKRGARWSVPPEYAGVIEDNFVTKAMDGIWNECGAFISQEL